MRQYIIFSILTTSILALLASLPTTIGQPAFAQGTNCSAPRDGPDGSTVQSCDEGDYLTTSNGHHFWVHGPPACTSCGVETGQCIHVSSC